MKAAVWLIVLIVCFSRLKSQQTTLSQVQYPEVGKPMPQFLLNNVDYYKKKEVSLADFKGKWLVLDFWNKYCSSCIANFPKMNKIQKSLGDRVQIILVGRQDHEGQIKTMYESFQKKMNLTLPCAFDSSICNYWGIYSTPQIIVIDNKGIVQAVTFELDSSSIQTFLDGGHPDLPRSYYAQSPNGNINEWEIPFDDRKPYMINNNGAKSNDPFLFRSLLTAWDQSSQHYYSQTKIDRHSIDNTFPKGMFQVLAADVNSLYRYAYFGMDSWSTTDTTFYGRYFNTPILEVSDSSIFQTSSTGQNRFCYSLILPPEKGTKENLERAMQRDLATYFGFDASIETRKMPYWRLMSLEGAAAKLRTKGGDRHVEIIVPRVNHKFFNVPMKQFIQYFSQFVDGIVIDETGIFDNIDIESNFSDFEELLAYLPKYGLKIVPAQKDMKVLVIRDPK